MSEENKIIFRKSQKVCENMHGIYLCFQLFKTILEWCPFAYV